MALDWRARAFVIREACSPTIITMSISVKVALKARGSASEFKGPADARAEEEAMDAGAACSCEQPIFFANVGKKFFADHW